jgi:RNA polymerase sigma-70 factor, ECF subfamily
MGRVFLCGEGVALGHRSFDPENGVENDFDLARASHVGDGIAGGPESTAPLDPETAYDSDSESAGDDEPTTIETGPWRALVERIQTGDRDAQAELYQIFARGVRFFLCRHLGSQELDDRVHDTFVIVILAIRRGELRDPDKLMGFVRTIARRQLASYIDDAVQGRRDGAVTDMGHRIADRARDPEQKAIADEEVQIMHKILGGISKRDREILTRFYLKEQTQEQICADMDITETQFRLLKSRAKARFGEMGRRKLSRVQGPTIFLRKTGSLGD